MTGFEWLPVTEMYKRYPQLKEDDIQILHKWIASQPHLPKINDLEVANFLHATYFRIEAAKTMIDNYYTYRTHLTNYFSDRDISGDDMVITHDVINFAVCPKRTAENHEITFIRIKDTDPVNFNFKNFEKIISFAIETELLEFGPADGYQLIMDVGGVKMGHLLKVNISQLKLIMMYMQEGLPIRIAGIHYINCLPFMEKIFSVIRQFTKSEFSKRLYMHESAKGLRGFVPTELLPKDYEGGQLDSIDVLSENYYQRLVERREYFLQEERTRKVKEALRPTKSAVINEYFGMEGTFRKLDID